MRVHTWMLCVVTLSIGPLCARAAAQNLDHDGAPGLPGAVVSDAAPSNVAPRSTLGDHVFGPIDVEGLTGDQGCLGVEAAFGFLYVTGRSTSVATRAIYKFDTAGNLLATFTQLSTAASAWGHRDLESDDAANVPGKLGHLWGGEENGHFVRYAVDAAGDLDGGTALTIPGMGVIRALALDLNPTSPSYGHFWTGGFDSPTLTEFDEAGLIYRTIPNPGKFLYGLALDPTNSNLLWLHSQDGPGGTTTGPDNVQWSEFDLSIGTLTGKSFQGILTGGANNIAGGGDLYADAASDTFRFMSMHQSSPDQLNGYDTGIPTEGSVTARFCTAKTGLVCGVPRITASGKSSASASSGFVVSAGPARSCRAGLLLLSQTMTAGMPFNGGTLCLQTTGLMRKGATNSGGTPGFQCDGAFAIDVNAFAQNQWMLPDCAGNPTGPVATSPPYLVVPGSGVFAQIWGRDTVTTGAFLSDALGWVVGP